MSRSQIIAMFDAGVPVDTIRKKYKISRLSIGEIICRGSKPTLDKKDIVHRYNSGEPLDRIGVRYSVDSGVIKRFLEDSKIEIRGHGAHSRIHVFHEDYFDNISDEHKAYWLGFLFGDGNVCGRLQQINVTLQRGDRLHLEKFVEDIGGSPSLVTDFVQLGRPYSKVTLSSKRMALDLFAKGCVPNKSLVVAGPKEVPQELERHFIRGLFDADGSITAVGNYKELSIVGNHELLSWCSVRLSGNPIARPNKTIWRIRSHAKYVGEWIDYLYKDSSVSLNRKFEKAYV